MKKNSAFTLIELLVVIAIIGILSSVVLASVNTARAKGADAAIKANLNEIRNTAELVYDTSSSYAGICTNASVTNMLNAAKTAAGISNAIVTAGATAGAAATITCHDSAAGWAAEAPMKTDTTVFFCVDSTGKAATSTGHIANGGSVVCP